MFSLGGYEESLGKHFRENAFVDVPLFQFQVAEQKIKSMTASQQMRQQPSRWHGVLALRQSAQELRAELVIVDTLLGLSGGSAAGRSRLAGNWYKTQAQFRGTQSLLGRSATVSFIRGQPVGDSRQAAYGSTKPVGVSSAQLVIQAERYVQVRQQQAQAMVD
ncbi:hypothetical protein AK812_SmicGene6323 [Symbiodinium microadriaticum]|uniref:Uncharacterized protein n=1 Tax=Symbiodinium microadriaticum TaxID=2951 RepID=A0A1Q9ERH1_SYMMI|nr:hypothetical protein AK812_SmicGene6323 [Symbiodinium microadriaticum]